MPHVQRFVRVGMTLLWMLAGCSAGPEGPDLTRRSPPGGEDPDPAVRADGAVPPPPPPPGTGPAPCTSDAECDDGDDCSTDLCGGIGGEFGTGMCEHGPAPACDPVTPPPTGDATDPVDPACAAASSGGETTRDRYGGAVFLPFRPLEASRLPLTCNDGFEWQNCRGTVEATATPPGGAREVTLEIDIATYTAGDHLRITGIDATGAEYVLLDTCRIRTWEMADPTDGRTRPPDETIRQFRTTVRAGTRSLTFDSNLTVSPWYMRTLGLCDFSLGAPTDTCDRAYRPASI